jgi:hypothetical protein
MDQFGKALGRAGQKKKGRKFNTSVGVETFQTSFTNFSKKKTDFLLIAAQEI